MNKILFIDDDIEFGKVFTELLQQNDFHVDFVTDVTSGLELEKNNEYELVIVDLYLEKFTGLQVVELIRAYNTKSKIMIMTNSVNDFDEVRALQLGVDEYLRKKSNFSLMLERITKVLNTPRKNTRYEMDLESKEEKITIDVENRIVEKDNENIDLTPLEFDLLVYLLRNKNMLLSRTEILENVWKLKKDEVFIDSRTVDVHIKNLRRKMNLNSIHSIRGSGYRWYEK